MGAHAAPTPRRPPRRDFALGVSALYGGWLVRLVWRNSAASSAFYGERGTGIAPRLPHPGEVSPGAPSVPVGTFVVSPFASLGLNQGLQSASVLNGCGWGEVCSLQAVDLQTGCEPLRGERAVRMRMNCATPSGATAASASAADERRTSRRAFTTPGCKGECKLY